MRRPMADSYRLIPSPAEVRHSISARRREIDRRSGFTLFEVAVAVVVGMIVALGAWMLLDRSASAVRSGMESVYLDSTLQRVLLRVAHELRDSGTDGTVDHAISHPRVSTTTLGSVTFETRVGFAGTTADWSTPITYQLVDSGSEAVGNGVDDDGDGVVDEGRLVRIQDSETLSIAEDVTGFLVARVAGEDVIRVTVTASTSLDRNEAPVVRSLSSFVALRNRE